MTQLINSQCNIIKTINKVGQQEKLRKGQQNNNTTRYEQQIQLGHQKMITNEFIKKSQNNTLSISKVFGNFIPYVSQLNENRN